MGSRALRAHLGRATFFRQTLSLVQGQTCAAGRLIFPDNGCRDKTLLLVLLAQLGPLLHDWLLLLAQGYLPGDVLLGAWHLPAHDLLLLLQPRPRI